MKKNDGIVQYEDIFSYGEVCGGILHIKKSFTLEIERKGLVQCALVTALTCYTGDEAPHICFSLTVDGQDEAVYKSHIYQVGEKNEYKYQSWRVPPMFLPEISMSVSVEIPDGTVLKIRDFGIGYSMQTSDWNGGLRHNAHLGFWDMAPDNTMPAFELAAMCGFSSCIVVPKWTADGELVCIHDDTINRTARDENGNPPKEEINVWDLTYEEHLKWEHGSYKNEIYRGVKMPRLEDFFALCAKTGMRPMFSTHPALTVEQWKMVKDMLIRFGLLKNFHIKSFYPDILETAYSVFGTEIEGYTFDINTYLEEDTIDKLLNIIDTSKCRVGIELRFDNWTKEAVRKVIDAGLFASAWNVKQRTSDEYNRLISFGVTEFTEDNHCSMGLNW